MPTQLRHPLILSLDSNLEAARAHVQTHTTTTSSSRGQAGP